MRRYFFRGSCSPTIYDNPIKTTHMEKISFLRFTLLFVFFSWIVPGNAQENKTTVSVVRMKQSHVEVFQFDNVRDKDKLQIVKLAGINLAPYQPSGWDDKIVVSTVTGTNTSASTIYNTQTIYLDLALANYGTSDVTQSVTSKLYIDGVLSKTITGSDIKAGTYKAVTDMDMGSLSAGPHTFKYVVDANGDVTETDESDNEYSRTINVTEDHSTICSNLTPHAHDGWDDKIVLSTVMGTSASATDFYDNQIIYLDWAVINNGTCDISGSFDTKLYVDDIEVSDLEVPGLAADYVLSKTDIAIGPLASGPHTFKVVCDANGSVTETNENDNEYTRTITVKTTICADVNITPYQPAGWDDKIVLSTVAGTNTSASTIYDNQSIYLDWAIVNNGSCNISETFGTKIYVDDLLRIATDLKGLDAMSYTNNTDINIGTLSAGDHTVRIVGDANGNVSETNENDNEYTRTITISPSACINVSPYQPPEWDDKIVLSTVTGTNTSSLPIYDNQIIYLDWALDNNGTCDISDTLYSKVYVDDVLIITYSTEGIPSNYYSYATDLNLGTQSAGDHTVRIVVDANNDVTESNESDNEYTRTFTISPSLSGIESLGSSTTIKIYPNPVSNELVVECKGNKERINFEILNSMGQMIYCGELFEKATVQTTHFAPGFYMVKFHNEKISGTKKIIKK
jgi:subtilase family serine protease